jgi:hypothetical protein
MKARSVLMVCALALVGAVASYAADVTGKWTAELPGRGGQTMTNTFEFKQDGAKLTGTISGGMGEPQEISEGTVEGDNVSFAVVREFNGNSIKMLYKGAVSGDEIKFTMTREGGAGGRGGRGPSEFVAKKAN